MRTIYDPVDVTATSPATPIPVPPEIIKDHGANALISLQVFEVAATVQIVGDPAQEKGCTINTVAASGYNAEVIVGDAQGMDLYAYAPAPTVVTFMFVVLKRRR